MLGRRADGYHRLATIFQTIDLCDELLVEPDAELCLECDNLALGDEDNLVLRAARLLREQAGVTDGARITLRKRIPVAAGLGGGSSDAAAALRALLRLWRLDLDEPAVRRLAKTLGADVPFLLRGGTALAGGVGDRLTPLPDPPRAWTVLLTPAPARHDKTARAYRYLSREDWSSGARTRRLAARLREGAWPDLALAPNAFERAADALFPELPAARQCLLAAGAPWARLTGSGPTLFTLLPDEARARAVHARLPGSVLAATLPAPPAVR